MTLTYTWQPFILFEALILTCFYFAALIKFERQQFEAWRVLSFIGAMLTFVFAFGSPIDTLSDTRLFSAHMLQHILETMVMTPLLLLSLSPQWIHWIMKVRGIRNLTHFFTKPILAAGVYNVVFGVFHFPFLYSFALRNEDFHFFEHVIFFVTAVNLWWPILDIEAGETTLTPGWKILYLLLNYNLMMPLSIWFIVSQHPLYKLYTQAPRTFGLVPLADQQLSGFIMIVGMFIPYLWVGIRAYKKLDVTAWVQ